MLSTIWQEDPLFNQLRNLLPDSGDAEHVFQAAKNKVSYLITVDHKSLLKYREAVEKLCGVRLVTPRTFEEAVLVKT
jgi:predicted nucleic acid-binding protein